MRPERRLKRRNGGGGRAGPGAPTQAPEWRGAAPAAPDLKSDRRSVTYCGRKMVLTMGATLHVAHSPPGVAHKEHHRASPLAVDAHGQGRIRNSIRVHLPFFEGSLSFRTPSRS